MSNKKNGKKVNELTQTKTKAEEKKFYTVFAETQLNAILLIILAATFLLQGIIRYLEIINDLSILTSWFNFILVALIFLTTAVVAVVLGGVLSPLKIKRGLNVTSFMAFLIGFGLFLVSLIYLFFSI